MTCPDFVVLGWRVSAVGTAGRINREMRDWLAETILAIHVHDANRLAEIVVSVATPLRPVSMPDLSRDLEEMLDVYADLSLGELSMSARFG